MKTLLQKKYTKESLFLIGILILFGLSCYKAYNMSFTHDESLSFQIITGDHLLKNTANHHILNTFLMKVSSSIFGFHEFPLRLPNVLLFLVYSISSLFIARRHSSLAIQIFCLALLFLNPFMFDFFTLARGYGISIGFLLLSIVFLMKAFDSKTNNIGFYIFYTFSSGSALLATTANLSLLTFLLALHIVFILKFISNSKKSKQFATKILIVGISTLLLNLVFITVLVNRILELNELNQLYFGASDLNGTFKSLIINYFYFEKPTNFSVYLIKYVILTFILVTQLISIVKNRIFSFSKAVFLLISLILVGLYLENIFFDANFPKGRTALFLYPLFGVLLVDSLSLIYKKYIKYRSSISFFLLPLVLFIISHFIISFSFDYTHSWQYDSSTKEVMGIINRETLKSDEKLSISNNWLFEPSINYYTTSRKIKLLKANRSGINLNSDFIYDFDQGQSHTGFQKIESFPTSRTTLFKKNN